MATNTLSRLVLAAQTARDLMTEPAVSIGADAFLREAIVLLADKGYGAAPVIDPAGRPVGVLSQTDIVVHDRERMDFAATAEYYHRAELRTKTGEPGKELQPENVDQTRVRDVMTPVVFSVKPDTPAAKVVSEMLALRVHRLFVVDDSGVLIGVISALDILKRLREE